jgi:hypothetical protein
MIVICDIDGTLSNHDHRLHNVTGKHKNYDAYYHGMSLDMPIPDAVPGIKRFMGLDGVALFLLTGRPERYRETTEKWLQLYYHGIYYVGLFMRPNGDFTKASKFKESVIEHLKLANPAEGMLFIDDDKRNAQMYSRHGIFLKAPECWSVIL